MPPLPQEQNLIERHISLHRNEVKKYFLLSMINFHEAAGSEHFRAELVSLSTWCVCKQSAERKCR
jgi:hypothetical protein